MDRFSRFAHNAGLIATIQVLIVLAILFFGLIKDFQTGLWVYTLPVLILSFLIGFAIRRFLVDHLQVVRWVMNAVVVAALLFLFTGGGSTGPGSSVERVLVAASIGLYISFYFWMLSDPLVSRQA